AAAARAPARKDRVRSRSTSSPPAAPPWWSARRGLTESSHARRSLGRSNSRMEDMMKKILVAVVAVGLLSGGAGVAWAATGDSTPGTDPASAAVGGPHARRGAALKLAVQVAADTIHIDRSALVKELRAGKTVADVA